MTAERLRSDVAPPELLQLAGHPLRWRLLAELAVSDRVVHELTELVGEPQNLVSYHLSKLRAGQLVSARRSSADRRDSYYSLDLLHVRSRLSAAGSLLHPGLRLTSRARVSTLKKPVRVLFLCTGNSARSPMAEALAKTLSDGMIKAYSAGSEPKPLHPNAAQIMRARYGLDLTAHKSKRLDVFAGKRFDWVISLCDRVREVCPEFPGQPQTVHWSIANPVTGDSDAVTYPLFRQTAAELETRIGFLLAVLADREIQGDTHGEPQ